MTINLTDPANHPANGQLTVERITRVCDALQRSIQYQNGGDMAYVIADAIKGLEELLASREAVPVMYCSQETIAASKDGEHLLRTLSTPSGDCVIPLYTAPPTPAAPEILPCPVLLEPGLRLGKGVKTQLLFDALKRRAEYCAELDAMTPEQRAEHDAGVAEFKAMLGGGLRDLSQPVDPQIAEYEKIIQQAVPDGWIPVSERMPEREVDVQVYCSDKKEQTVGYMERNEKDGWFRFASLPNGGGVYCKTTHWQPLPAAPQEVRC